MYPINDQQIAYILNDIDARGIRLKGLRESLLDHICIIIEQNLEEGGDFEGFYASVIRDFYKKSLKEIEEETRSLLFRKNDNLMKKAMILSGAFSVAAFITGSVFKIMQLRFSPAPLALGFITIAFVFLPLLCMVKCRELNANIDRLIWSLGTLVGILYCISMLELFLHFEHKAMIWRITLAISFFVFIPIYFFTGIRSPEKRISTIVISVLMVAITGIQFSLTALYTPAATRPETPDKPATSLHYPSLTGKARPTTGNTDKAISVSYR